MRNLRTKNNLKEHSQPGHVLTEGLNVKSPHRPNQSLFDRPNQSLFECSCGWKGWLFDVKL